MNLDWIRVIATIFVIAIHTYPFATINENVDFLFTHVFCRIAVPLFLMITGYYVVNRGMQDKTYLIQYTKKIARLYGICILIYLPINIYAGIFETMHVSDYIKWIFFNGTFYHLWYFPALLLGIWILYFLMQHTKEWLLQTILFFLFLIGLFGDSYYGITLNISFLKSFYDVIFLIFDYTRNGIFYVPIFLYLGYYFSKIKWTVSLKSNLLLFIYFIVFLELEGFLLQQYALQRHDSMYILLIPTMICLFPLLLQANSKADAKIRNIATTAYIIHPLMIVLIRGVAKVIHLEAYLVYKNLIHFGLVVLLSFGCSILVETIKQQKRWKS